MFQYGETSSNALLETMLMKYEINQQPIYVNFRKSVGCITPGERVTHLIHPYPAKLLMHIPYFFLSNDILSKSGDIVLDPFAGSGTVMLESILSGKTAYGVDSNPLARLIAKVKTKPISPQKINKYLKTLLDNLLDTPRKQIPDVVNLNYWFYPIVINQLQCIKEAISKVSDSAIRDFFEVCFSSCVKKVSLADPRLSVPVRLRSDKYPIGHFYREKAQQHINSLKRINVAKVFENSVVTNCSRMSQLYLARKELACAKVIGSDARNLCYEFSNNGHRNQDIENNSIGLILTSPPYPGAQKYIRSSGLSLGWLNMCPSKQLIELKIKTIGREEFYKNEYASLELSGVDTADIVLEKIYAINPVRAAIAGVYLNEMRQSLDEMYRVLSPEKYAVIVIAKNTICGCIFNTEEYITKIAEGLGFITVLKLVDKIHSRALLTKRNETANIIQEEWILVFKK